MNFNELSLEEQELILNNRLDKLNLKVSAGSCELTAVNIIKDENKVVLAIIDKFADKQILLTLSDDHINMLYTFIKTRHGLLKSLSKVQNTLNTKAIKIEDVDQNVEIL